MVFIWLVTKLFLWKGLKRNYSYLCFMLVLKCFLVAFMGGFAGLSGFICLHYLARLLIWLIVTGTVHVLKIIGLDGL